MAAVAAALQCHKTKCLTYNAVKSGFVANIANVAVVIGVSEYPFEGIICEMLRILHMQKIVLCEKVRC